VTALPLAQTQHHAEAILDEVERAVVGKRTTLELLLAGMLADGHILLEDYPGVAKTLIARSFSDAIGASFTRFDSHPVHARSASR
jgi:MoxR-like ATPase